jgi:hypothetical protein
MHMPGAPPPLPPRPPSQLLNICWSKKITRLTVDLLAPPLDNRSFVFLLIFDDSTCNMHVGTPYIRPWFFVSYTMSMQMMLRPSLVVGGNYKCSNPTMGVSLSIGDPPAHCYTSHVSLDNAWGGAHVQRSVTTIRKVLARYIYIYIYENCKIPKRWKLILIFHINNTSL